VPSHGAGGGELQGGFVYYDYQSLFPERLLLDWALTATGQGAILLNHCELTGVEYHAEPTKRVAAVVVRDLLTDTDHKISTGLLINASGPYMDLVPGLADVAGPHLTRAAGIHLITDPLFPSGQNHSIIVSARRNHSFLILPWQGRALIGPTDQPYEGHPDALVPRAAEVDLLVADLKEALPPGVFRRDMIRHVITGIRPLVSSGAPAAGGSTTRGLSRKSEIFDHAPAVRGLLSVGGGKWTTSRALGERVIKIARKQLKSPGRHAKVDTARDALAGAPGFAESAQEYAAFALREYATPGIPDPVHRHLITMYGTRHSLVLELARDTPALAARISERSHCLDILAQVDFAIQNESAANLDDIVRRRLSIGMFGEPAADELATIAERAADLLGWDAERRRLEIAAVHKIFRAAMAALQPG
jgi:glycerol-3-phosphate dehydrogenase